VIPVSKDAVPVKTDDKKPIVIKVGNEVYTPIKDNNLRPIIVKNQTYIPVKSIVGVKVDET
jgi:hypothetical protein